MDHGNWGGRKLHSTKDWRKGSEYGGVEGLLPPESSPHDSADHPVDILWMMRNTNPGDRTGESGNEVPPTKMVRKYNG